MSSLQVDSISSMGGGHVDGAGLVVQYVETSDDRVATSIEVNSGAWTNIGITLSFTPEFIGSKVCVQYIGSMGFAPPNNTLNITLFKDGVQAPSRYGLGFIKGDNSSSYSPITGQYVFTTTSLNTIVFAVYAKRPSGTSNVTPVSEYSSYVLSATEYAQ